MSILNFPKIPKIALRKFCELSGGPWRSKYAKSTQDYFLLGGSSYLYSPHGVINMIFGIFGRFGIEIGDRDFFLWFFFDRKNVIEKKSKICWSKKKIENWLVEKKIDFFFRPTIFDRPFWSYFFSMKNKYRIFFGYLFRSQIFQRFQKSHLENRPMSFRTTFVFNSKIYHFSSYLTYEASREKTSLLGKIQVRGRLPGPFCYKSNKLNAGVVFRCSMIIPFQEKNPEQKY